MKCEGTDKWGYELARKTLSPSGKLWTDTNYGVDYLQGRLNVNTEGIVPTTTKYFHQRSNSHTSQKSFTSQRSTSLPSGGTDIKKVVIARPASMLTAQQESNKTKVLGDFHRFLESDAAFSKQDQVYKRPPIFNAGKGKVKKALKQFMTNDTGHVVNGRVLCSPSPSKVVKGRESPKPEERHHGLTKTMNED
jgi:hypothetical protein